MKKFLFRLFIVLTSFFFYSLQNSFAIQEKKCFDFDKITKTILLYNEVACGYDVDIPKQIDGEYVENISDEAFKSKKLTSVVIPDSVKTIGDFAFAYNELVSIVIPDSVINIGNGAFSQNKLTSITIPKNIKIISNGIFEGNKLDYLIIPDSIINIGDSAFNENKLVSIKLGNSLENIGNRAFSYNRLTSLTIPNSVKNIGRGAFLGNKIDTIKLGNSLENIGPDAFNTNNLFSIIIPDSVQLIGKDAFKNQDLLSGNYLTGFVNWNPNLLENKERVKNLQGSSESSITYIILKQKDKLFKKIKPDPIKEKQVVIENEDNIGEKLHNTNSNKVEQNNNGETKLSREQLNIMMIVMVPTLAFVLRVVFVTKKKKKKKED